MVIQGKRIGPIPPVQSQSVGDVGLTQRIDALRAELTRYHSHERGAVSIASINCVEVNCAEGGGGDCFGYRKILTAAEQALASRRWRESIAMEAAFLETGRPALLPLIAERLADRDIEAEDSSVVDDRVIVE